MKPSIRVWGNLEVSVACRRSLRVGLSPSSLWWVRHLLLSLPMLFFWDVVLWITSLKVSGEPAMAPPPFPSRIPSLDRRSSPKPRRWVRVDLLFWLVSVAGRIVVGKGGAGVLRRGFGAGYGGHRPELGKEAAPSLSSSQSQWQPSIFRSTLSIRTYPFGSAFLLKKPWISLRFNPRSLAYYPTSVSSFWKRISSR
jgi:hypothetical protein